MDRTLHEPNNAQRILKLTADTMLLIDREGVCKDIDTHSDLWFLQEEKLLGKNIFELLPAHTREKVSATHQTVLREQRKITKNFKLELEQGTYYFKCIMQPYDDMVLCQYRDITQRSNVKRQLELANRNLREIQKVAKIGHWTHNTFNDTFQYKGHTGVLCEEIVKVISFDEYLKLIAEEDRQCFINWCEENKKGCINGSINYRIFTSGEVYYMRLQAFMSELQPNGSYNIEGYIQNITDIQRSRNDINTLTHAINNTKESIFAAKEDGTLIFANRQFMLNHGINENAEIGQLKIYEIVGDMSTADDWRQRYGDIRHGGSKTLIIHHPLKSNKNILAFEGSMYNVTNDEGEISYWSFTHDISERLHYEAKIKRLNLIMDTTIDHLPAGIVVKEINNDFRYIYRNRESYNRDLCYGDSIGKNDHDYYPPEVAEEKRKEDIYVATTGKGLHWTFEGRDKNGKQIILDKRKIRVDGDDLSSPIIVSIEWDITEMEHIKRELEISKEKAEMSDKLKSAFLANMSHEIRTPLNAIVGFSHLISKSENAEERKNFYNIVEANNERLLELINEILDLSKIESGTIEFTYAPVKLHNLCKEVHDAHIFRTPDGVKLIYEPSDTDLIIQTDKNRVIQVFSNLIGNAFKFTKEGSVSYGYKTEGKKIAFHVTDTGTGIEPEKVGRVFERFAKLNNYAQGTGLGLSICKTIIERLGGEISVSSELGKGSTFKFTLPNNFGDSAAEKRENLMEDLETHENNQIKSTFSIHDCFTNEDVEMNGGAGGIGKDTSGIDGGAGGIDKNTGGIDGGAGSIDGGVTNDNSLTLQTILVAEDTDSNYDLLYAILGKKYRLIRARDGMEAVTIYDEVKPDLILMDIKMPNLDGLQATKIIRELSATVPIIAQSAYAYQQDLIAADEAGCNDFIAKPISQAKLKEKIKKWLP